jgi:hypothetical protein
MYSIDGLCPSGQPLGGYGFQIHLAPLFRDAVTAANLTQVEVDRVLATYGQEWLQKCGFARYFDPENCGFRERHPAIPSPETRPTYNHRELRVRWGPWGPEHISVPGNACGLDLGRAPLRFTGGAELLPHNVDSWSQVLLLLVTFTWFADYVLLVHATQQDKESKPCAN